MNDQKPLSTQDIARGQNESDRNQKSDLERTDDIENSDRSQRDTSISPDAATSDARRSMEAGYSAGGMPGGISGSQPSASSGQAALMPVETAESHREHWSDIQAKFVDDPKAAVEQADELVAEVIQIVASRFAEQRKGLEGQWQEGGEASSEDLRQAFLQYRSFFERLLAA